MLDEADERWIAEHGFLVDNPLLAEVERAADSLREMPEIGIVYIGGRFRNEVRRLILRSGWHLYYSFDPRRSLIVIVAVWYGSRGSDPPL